METAILVIPDNNDQREIPVSILERNGDIVKVQLPDGTAKFCNKYWLSEDARVAKKHLREITGDAKREVEARFFFDGGVLGRGEAIDYLKDLAFSFGLKIRFQRRFLKSTSMAVVRGRNNDVMEFKRALEKWSGVSMVSIIEPHFPM